MSQKSEMFTRGQIEWAIAQVTGRTVRPGGEPRHDLQMKLKRLLDIDRKKGIDAAQAWPEFRRFAFLEGGIARQGRLQFLIPLMTRLRCSSASICWTAMFRSWR